MWTSPDPVREISIPYTRRPPMQMRWTWGIAMPSSRKAALTRICATLLTFFGHFLDLFGLASPVMCTRIPLCARNSATLEHRVRHKPYYTGCTRNSRHNHATTPDIFGIMCIFPVWHQMAFTTVHMIYHTKFHHTYPAFYKFFFVLRFAEFASSASLVYRLRTIDCP